ncbi:MAG: hypothetical protein NC084_05695 [Bacteroides sp.]|nr:hypothetical protein [Eubacterium sp.]MCM1418047.1 hypothetical protein [Roseburia sp.]MCM1462191.1 hypothetical protein [Bacteroides sp.]
MHEILKRALNEALTVPYARELFVEPTEHVFSAAFEKEMRALIRKTDRVAQKYIRIMAVAACAAIAVGCAVLLPRIMDASIDVHPIETEETTSATTPGRDSGADLEMADTEDEIAEDTTDQDEETILEEPTEDEEPEETSDLPDDNTTSGGASPSPTTTAFEASGAEDAPAEGSEVSGNASDATVPTDTEALPPTGDGDDVDNDDVDDDDDIDDDDAPLAGGDTDVEVLDEADMDDADTDAEDDDEWYDDDAEEVTSDDSDDDDASFDNDEDTVVDNEQDENPNMGVPAIPSEATLGEEVRALIGCGISDSFLQSGYCLIDGERYELPIAEGFAEEIYRDQEIAKLLEAAERTERPTAIGEELLYVRLIATPPTIPAINEFDFSPRKDYGSLFGGGDPEDEEDLDVDVEDDAEVCRLRVYTDGIVAVDGESYSGAEYYRLGEEALERLTERLRSRYRSFEPKKVGDLSALIGSRENYARIAVRIGNYYDCLMSGQVADGAFLEKLLKKYDKTKLIPVTARDHTPVITVSLTSKKALRRVSFEFCADGTVYFGGYGFTIKEAEVRAILTEYCKQKELATPVFYNTLDEYLIDKNFNEIGGAELSEPGALKSYELSDEKTLDKLKRSILDGAGESAYLPGGVTASSADTGYIRLYPKGWSASITIDNDTIHIVGTPDRFKTPEGLYDKLCELIRRNGIASDIRVAEEEVLIDD